MVTKATFASETQTLSPCKRPSKVFRFEDALQNPLLFRIFMAASFWACPSSRINLHFFGAHRANCGLLIPHLYRADISCILSKRPTRAIYGLKFRIVLLFWLPTTTKESSLFCYLTHGGEGRRDRYIIS